MNRVIGIAFLVVIAVIAVVVGLMVIGSSSRIVPPAQFPGNLTKGISLGIPLLLSPETAAVYRVTGHDAFSLGGPEIMEVRENIPTEDEATALAGQVMEEYGGLPEDSVIARVERVTVKQYNLATGTVEAEYPRYTAVIYRQKVAGHPVVGPGAGITVELGEDGEVLQVEKVWRSLEYDHEIAIIPVEEAFGKLEKRELVKPPQCSLDGLHILDIQIGYYAEDREINQEFFYPVWIFYGTLHPEIDKTLYPFIVDAKKTKTTVDGD